MTDYNSILPKGKENAISSKELARIMRFDNVRVLQSDIAKSREQGQLICSSTTGGYFTPLSESEVNEFINVLKARALNTLKAIRDTKRAMRNGLEEHTTDINTHQIKNRQLTINDYLETVDKQNENSPRDKKNDK